jgi:phosphohistidine phosphatase SixA
MAYVPQTGVHSRGEELVAVLAKPGRIGIMRHALAPMEGAPPADKQVLGDCTTQRNLNDVGRDDARRIGTLFAKAGYRPEHILTSGWCRCRETAELIAGRAVENAKWLDSFFRKPENTAAQLADLRWFAYSIGASDRALLVTHGSFVVVLTGIEPKESEIVVLERDTFGGLKVVGRGIP